MIEGAREVPNPRRAELERLRRDLAREVETLRSALRSAHADMAGDKVWVGRNARSWQRELGGRDRRLREQVDGLLPLLDAAIRKEPERVAGAEARSYEQGS
ncbi:hypothetical protein [Streptomyces sp. SCSIO ZS0520]|uniref:hypothetical protein n=1 Tax=Streptomyces sp. SCSIO ZS0520 TaxID=2892996 RepID=UPI0021D9C8B8|nr:hypothetical protein [Streptomyces sp. SCSIO ZS0520]